MKILISNDDGYLARGINVLADKVREIAEVRVVAPDRNRSAASNSLTLETPLRIQEIGNNIFAINGTPTDCVHLAMTGMFDDDPDMVISGINHGANLGDDTIYSGTVAAAMEGRFLGLPAIAVSLGSNHHPRHFDTAARVVVELIEKIISDALPRDTILNVNVPDVDYESLNGMRATRLGFRHRSESVYNATDPSGREVFWIGPAGGGQDAGPGTDFHAIAENAVSISPLKIDLTRHEQLDALDQWLHP